MLGGISHFMPLVSLEISIYPKFTGNKFFYPKFTGNKYLTKIHWKFTFDCVTRIKKCKIHLLIQYVIDTQAHIDTFDWSIICMTLTHRLMVELLLDNFSGVEVENVGELLFAFFNYQNPVELKSKEKYFNVVVLVLVHFYHCFYDNKNVTNFVLIKFHLFLKRATVLSTWQLQI